MTEFPDRGIRFDNSGPVEGSVFQFGTASAVNVNVSGRTATVPREVPSAVPFFTDRAGVLAYLDQLCGSADQIGSKVAVLTGPRGVGKSAVVRRWAHLRADRYPDGQIYVNLGGTPSAAVTAADVAASVLTRLGVPREELGGLLDGRVERFRSAVAGKRVLLVLDHAVTASQIVPFVTSSADVVVTAASALGALRLHGARFRYVDCLDEPFASALFRDIAGLDDVDDSTGAVVAEIVQQFCGRLPLAIALCAAMYAGKPARETLGQWFERLRSSVNPLSRIRVEGEIPLQEVFDDVYRNLDPLEARVYRSVGVLPTGRFTVAHVAAMLSMTSEAAGDVLLRLVDKCVLTVDAGFFEVHGLIQRHARDAAEAHSREEADQFRCRVVDFVTACVQSMDRAMVSSRLRVAAIADLPEIAELADPDDSNRWFAAEHSVALGYMRLARDCGQWRHVCAMSEAWWSPAYRYRHLDSALELSDFGIEVAEAIGDAAISARLLGQSALVCVVAGDLQAASGRLDRAYRWLSAVEADYVRLRLAASLLEYSGKLAEARGDLDDAQAAFIQSRDYCRALNSVRGEALQNYHLAKLAYRRGRHVEAAGLVAGALERLDAVGDSLTVGQLSVFRARCLIEAHEPLAAREELAALCASKVFSEAEFLLGQMHECMAAAAEAVGDDAGARESLVGAQAAYDRCGSDRATVIAQRLSGG